MDASFREWIRDTLEELLANAQTSVTVQGDATVVDPEMGAKLDAVKTAVENSASDIRALTELYQQNFAATALISYLLFVTNSVSPPPGMKNYLEQQLGFTLPDPPA